MAHSHHSTLTPNTVMPVTLDNHAQTVEIVNRTGIGEIWVRLDGNDPVVAGDNCYVVLGSRRFEGLLTLPGSALDIRLISTQALAFSVEGGGL